MLRPNIEPTSPTEASKRPTCARCIRPLRCCVCAQIRHADNETPVIVVQHPREHKHPFGTVRLAQLVLRTIEVHVAAPDDSGQLGCPPCAPPGAVLLYPSPGATTLEDVPEPPSALVVVDGTWYLARKLAREIPWLAALPRVALAPETPGRYRFRKAQRPEVQLSTIEAIERALAILEPENLSLRNLQVAFDAMVERQLEVQRQHRTSQRDHQASHPTRPDTASTPGPK